MPSWVGRFTMELAGGELINLVKRLPGAEG